MKLITILCVVIISLMVACAPATPAKNESATEPVVEEVINSSINVTASDETTDDDIEGALDEVDEAGEEETAPEAEAAPVETITTCPLLSAEAVQKECGIVALPNATVEDGHCVFRLGPYTLNVSSTTATKADLDDWMALIYTSDESGELAPYGARAEMSGIKYFAWFTGAKLVIAASSNVLICTGDKVDNVAGAINLKAIIGTEVDAWTELKTHITFDSKAITMDNVAMAKLLSMSFDYEGDIIPRDGNSTGEVKASFEDKQYSMLATIETLAQGSYQGWIVRKGSNASVISTGELKTTSEGFINAYASGNDLTDHTFYIVTSGDTVVMEGHLEN